MLIADIKPDPDNERDHSKGIPELMASIQDAGFVGTIALRSHDDPTVVAGHGRLEALKRLGWTELPDDHIEFLDHLTDEEAARFRLNDNKTSDLSRWNKAKLKASVRKLEAGGFDMGKFGFNFKSKHLPYGAEKLKGDRVWNLRLCNIDDCAGPWEMPTLEPVDALPPDFISFNFCKSATDFTPGVHFCIDDYQFERVWNSPEQYLELLRKFDCVVCPDFSVYMDMPLPMKLWNLYRSRALGHWWQQRGITVIPNVTWSGEDSFTYCLEGCPQGGTIFISTVGVTRNKESAEIVRKGTAQAIETIQPSRILMLGKPPKIDYHGVEVVEFKPRAFRS